MIFFESRPRAIRLFEHVLFAGTGSLLVADARGVMILQHTTGIHRACAEYPLENTMQA